MLNRFSITSQMIASSVITSFIIVFLGMSFNIWYSVNYEKKSFLSQSSLESELISDMLAAPLAFFDKDGINENLQRLKYHDDILNAVVYSIDKTLVSSYSIKGSKLPLKMSKIGIGFTGDNSWVPWKFGILKNTVEIKQHSQILGYLSIDKNTDKLTLFIIDYVKNSLYLLLILIYLVYLTSRILSKKILQPVLILSQTAKKISQTKDYSIRVSHDAKNEITSLYKSFNMLLAETQDLTHHLESRVQVRTKELQESLDTLKFTQKQLLESEKMAALGNLVSGVAHEVNTPLGNALTGGSIIMHETKILLRAIDSGEIKKSTMMDGLNTLNKSAEVLLISIKRAADLIRSFKRISIDQTVEEKQDFNLSSYIEEVLVTFHNKLKKIPVEVTIKGDKNLIIKSYPGVFAQIISNLIQNSLIHGFEGINRDAIIVINIHIIDDKFELTYSDNGVGMDKDIEAIAFEPFSTTKRNKGGTGLGLNIVYNLITQKLGGSVILYTNKNEGVKYKMLLPLNILNKNQEEEEL